MDRENKEPDEKRETVRHILFEGFESEEEFIVALKRLDQYLQTLRDWREKPKWTKHIPPETLN